MNVTYAPTRGGQGLPRRFSVYPRVVRQMEVIAGLPRPDTPRRGAPVKRVGLWRDNPFISIYIPWKIRTPRQDSLTLAEPSGWTPLRP